MGVYMFCGMNMGGNVLRICKYWYIMMLMFCFYLIEIIIEYYFVMVR